MTQPLRVLFLVPTLRRGGAETQLISLANNLIRDVFKCHIISFDSGLDQLDKLDKAISFHHFLRRTKYDFNIVRNIAELIDKEQVDIIHCTLHIALFYGWAAKIFSSRKPRLATTVHTTKNRDFRSEIFDWMIYQWIMRSCNSIIFVCEEQRRHWERKWRFIKRKSLVVYNGIDVQFFRRPPLEDATQFRMEYQIPSNTKVIAHIAGFRPEKGHRLLIEAFKQLMSKRSDVLLIFAGDGVLRKHCEEIIRRDNLSANVRFIGNVSDVRPLLANADIAVIASTAVETFSIAMLEAMSMEIPLVATDIGGTREAVIPKETGWLIPPGNVNALADALIESLADDGIRAARAHNARQYVVNNFTLTKMAGGMEQLFKTITSK